MHMGRLRAFAAALIAILACAVPARAAEPSPAMAQRAGDLVALFNGTAEPERVFSPAFLRQIPAAQVKSISAQMKANYGNAIAVQRVEAKSGTAGIVFLDFERAVVRAEIAIGAAPPHLIEQLLVAGGEVKGDSVAAVFGEIVALPGEVSLAAAKLEDRGPA